MNLEIRVHQSRRTNSLYPRFTSKKVLKRFLHRKDYQVK